MLFQLENVPKLVIRVCTMRVYKYFKATLYEMHVTDYPHTIYIYIYKPIHNPSSPFSSRSVCYQLIINVYYYFSVPLLTEERVELGLGAHSTGNNC